MKLYFYDKKTGHKREDTDRLIRESLESYISGYSLPPYNGEIKRTALGKPYIDYPLFIGVTHTDDIVIVGIDEAPFGIDTEKAGRKMERCEKIAERFFTENELLQAHDDESFLDIWVKKEAYVKFTGEGVPAMKNCDVTLLSGFERIENNKDLIIYIYKE
jgi:phosphopantetheinyl transferase